MQADTKIATVKATQMMKYTVKTASEEASARFR